MSKKDIICGVDVGSYQTRTVIAELVSSEEKPRIIGVGVSPSGGVRKGVIVDLEETVKSINDSLEQAERIAGINVKEVSASIGGNHITSQISRGVIAVSGGGEVSEEDVERVINAAQAISIPANKEILHIIPKNYSLDEQKNIKDPLGMSGIRLEVEAMIIEGSTPFIKNLFKCFEQAGVSAGGLVLSSLAAAKSSLSKRQKELGVVLIDIGGGTTSLAVFEENELLYSGVIPIGGNHITNDIAIGLRTSIDVAERVKLEFGSALLKEISHKEEINLSEIDSGEEGAVSRYHVAEIIEARLEEIFSLVNKELKKIGKDSLLPAGVVITGGTAKLPGVVDLAKDVLALPAQTGFPEPLGGLVDKVDDPSFAVATGLILWKADEFASSGKGFRISKGMSGEKAYHSTSGAFQDIKKWISRFLP